MGSDPAQTLWNLTIVAVVAQRDNQPPWQSTDKVSTCRRVCPALCRLGYAPSSLHGVLPGIRTQNLLIHSQDTYALSVFKVCRFLPCFFRNCLHFIALYTAMICQANLFVHRRSATVSCAFLDSAFQSHSQCHLPSSFTSFLASPEPFSTHPTTIMR